IFDDGHEKAAAAHAAAAPAPLHAGGPANARVAPKATLLGLAGAPLPPPPATSRPATAPPPALRSGFPQAGTSSLPPPMHGLPPPPQTQPGLGGAFPVRSQIPPPPHAASSPPGPLGMPVPTPFPRQSHAPDYLLTPHKMEATALVRPPRKRTALWVALGLAGVAVLGVLWMYGGGAHTGRIVVNVTDAKGASVNRVDIFVDGHHQCDTAPCLVDSVAAGDHEVKVLADGFDAPPVQQIAVEGHKDATASFSLGGAKGSGVKVSGTQPGVKLYVDDKEIGPLPQDLHDLAPGDHAIRIAGSERYQPIEKHVTVEKDQSVDLGSVTLKVLKGKATINPGTPGARVYLVSGSDRRELPMLPISVDIDTAKNWALEANKSGFDDFKQPISFDDGQAEKTLTVTLEPRTGGAPAVAYSPPPAPAPAPAPAPVAAAAPAAAAAEGGEGFLNINSIPPSTCFLDGRSLGSTPRVHVSVKPGSHTVKFINADQGLTKTLTVSVGAGETRPAVAKLN
ncbi:MAG TPA: PEGA domain-containing protein, partial [Polyangiaceae bacterium]|nr:PEGA domain-containing protein [Polyangiaceae bacterium]